ncbi:hypothetical protein GOP47_0002486 [Adiantum capillus-veneris]|uniref:CW-type domain-containing protein n=1 Tax=Adiantum capillus-veneris TaxID=13818 RepID=A0A9D4VBV0_ADICA|nr:hypothetical protein GOP47_0002486 [Adiantum capillus-veneris]
MGDHELEEGEACDEPDLSCDPDTDFSYLDEKLSVVLGDQQKCFEGGVSAEKLGSKFGGYGSFLPTQERPPSILHQERPASVLASDTQCRTRTNDGMIERIKQNASCASVRASSLSKGSGSAVLTHENGGGDSGPVNEKVTNVASSFLIGRAEDKTGLPKKVTLKIKMGSETKEKKKNATIYSDFGLSNSSSEEEEEFVDEDGRTDSDPDTSPDRTPLTMIRLMTSHHIPDGMLLSPLRDLVTEPFMQKERLWLACEEVKVRSPGLKKVNLFQHGDTFETLDNPKEQTMEYAGETKGNSARSSDRSLKRVKVDKERGGSKDSSRHVSKPPPKAYAKDLAKASEVERQVRDAVSESGTGVRSNDSHKEFKGFSLDRALPDYVLYDGDHIPKDFCSPFQPPKEVDSGREQQSRGSRADKVASSSHESINEHRDLGNQGPDASKEFVNTLGIISHGKRHAEVSLDPSNGKKRSSGKVFVVPSEEKTKSGQNARSSTSKGKGGGKVTVPAADIPTREMADSKKRSIEFGHDADVLRGSSREKGKVSYKEIHMSSGRDKYLKTSSEADLLLEEIPKGGPQHSSKVAGNKDYKDFQQVDLPKVHKAESLEHKRKEKVKRRVTPDYVHKEPSKVSEDRQRETATRDVSTKVPQPSCVPEAVSTDMPSQAVALPPPPAANGVAPYVLVMDNWVGCDKCQKWRLLPPGVDEGNLPHKWHCKMLYWLEKEGLNNCSIPEAVTDQATQALYNISAPIPPPIQENPPVGEQVQPPPVVTSLPPVNLTVNQEMKASEKIRGAASTKKHKIPRTGSSDNTVPGKAKSFAEAPPVTQDASQAKLDGGDTILTQEKIQAKVEVLDLGSVKTGEGKQKVKERDKARRHRPSDGLSPSAKKHSQTPANLVLRDATKLKHKADSLQGQERPGTALYLQAALKFLQAASMLETEASEHGDNRPGPLPVQLYADTAKLCEYCASTYERNKDLAVAALAYKCAGVARMRVVQAKSSLISKCRAEVQSRQQVAQGDSPSSSTQVDMDAPKNSSMDRALAHGSTPPTTNSHAGGPLIIAAKSRTSFNRILDYVMDTGSALDALTKSVNAFTAAESALSSFTTEGMSALRKVLDFSFHDVDSFVRLVRIALEAMGH